MVAGQKMHSPREPFINWDYTLWVATFVSHLAE